MTISIVLLLFFAGVGGGLLNAVAGGGSFVSFPALLFVKVPPIPANATSTVALWMGAAASGGAYRKRLDVPRRVMVPLLCVSLVGSAIGAYLLLKTPAHAFLQVLPWLTLAATLLFTFGRKIAGRRALGISHGASRNAIIGAAAFQFAVGIYGGYFGGGMGIVMLAMLATIGLTDIHTMNALKSLMVFVINGVAIVMFVVAKAVYWPQGLTVAVGAIVGGYFGAHYAQRIQQIWIRRFVIATGTAMTVYFFWKAYAGL